MAALLTVIALFFFPDMHFLTPQEVYDKVVVIDAGHGGRGPGAIKQGIYDKSAGACQFEFRGISGIGCTGNLSGNSACI